MDAKTKKILIISGIVAGIGAIIGIIIYKGKKSSPATGTATNPVTGSSVTISGSPTATTGTAIDPATGAKVSTTTAASSTPGVASNPWIRFNWFSGQEYGAATGLQLSNISELPKTLGPGTKIEIKMEANSTQTLNGIHTVKYLGDDTTRGSFVNGMFTISTATPANPTNLPKSGYFRVV